MVSRTDYVLGARGGGTGSGGHGQGSDECGEEQTCLFHGVILGFSPEVWFRILCEC